MRFIDFFDRIYIINLPYRTDRRKEMAKELKIANMPFCKDKVELFKATRPEESHPFKSIGCKGAFISHLNVLKKAQAEGLKNVLIMEDDLHIKPIFQQYEEDIIQKLLSIEWDIVQFGYFLNDEESNNFSLKIKSMDNVSGSKNQVPMLQPFSGQATGAHFYAINNRTFTRLITFLEALLDGPLGDPEKGPMHVDGAYNVFKWKYSDTIRLFSVPTLGEQRSSSSDISPQWFDKIYLLRKLVNLTRRTKFISVMRRAFEASSLRP